MFGGIHIEHAKVEQLLRRIANDDDPKDCLSTSRWQLGKACASLYEQVKAVETLELTTGSLVAG